jgi:hypothetical protein
MALWLKGSYWVNSTCMPDFELFRLNSDPGISCDCMRNTPILGQMYPKKCTFEYCIGEFGSSGVSGALSMTFLIWVLVLHLSLHIREHMINGEFQDFWNASIFSLHKNGSWLSNDLIFNRLNRCSSVWGKCTNYICFFLFREICEPCGSSHCQKFFFFFRICSYN